MFNPINGFSKPKSKKRKSKLKVEWARVRLGSLRKRYQLDGEVTEVYFGNLNPNRKALAHAPNRGFKRTKPPTPNGKGVGAFRVIRPKVRG